MSLDSPMSISELAKPYFKITSEQDALISKYIELVFKFNKSKSLTSISTSDQWISTHVMDSIAAYSVLANHLQFDKIIDCGSGNGLPGIVFSILSETLSIDLYDTDSKKCQFLKTVVHRLSLMNTSVSNTSILDINNVPRGTIFVYRAFSPIKLMHESISKHSTTHCYFATADHIPKYSNFREYLYELPDNSHRKLIIV